MGWVFVRTNEEGEMPLGAGPTSGKFSAALWSVTSAFHQQKRGNVRSDCLCGEAWDSWQRDFSLGKRTDTQRNSTDALIRKCWRKSLLSGSNTSGGILTPEIAVAQGVAGCEEWHVKCLFSLYLKAVFLSCVSLCSFIPKDYARSWTACLNAPDDSSSKKPMLEYQPVLLILMLTSNTPPTQTLNIFYRQVFMNGAVQ